MSSQVCSECGAKLTSSGHCSNFACAKFTALQSEPAQVIKEDEAKEVKEAPVEYKSIKTYCKHNVDNYVLVKATQNLCDIVVEGEDEAIFYTAAGQVGSYQGRKLMALVVVGNELSVKPAIFSAADIKKIQRLGELTDVGYVIVRVTLHTSEDSSVTKKILPVSESVVEQISKIVCCQHLSLELGLCGKL